MRPVCVCVHFIIYLFYTHTDAHHQVADTPPFHPPPPTHIHTHACHAVALKSLIIIIKLLFSIISIVNQSSQAVPVTATDICHPPGQLKRLLVPIRWVYGTICMLSLIADG